MFEITESVIMLDPDEALVSLTQMKEAGFKLAIDDFGTGYSSLNYLKTLPVDYLKIDLDFIRNLHQSEEDQEIVRAIITSAQALGLKVIAEGVETQAAFKWLQAEGCGYAQGFYFAKPMPTEEVSEWLKKYSFEDFDGQIQLF
jgi:EAL domain-containing protein (putative c-di-GMP-specific phosphodiesterase class I)